MGNGTEKLFSLNTLKRQHQLLSLAKNLMFPNHINISILENSFENILFFDHSKGGGRTNFK